MDDLISRRDAINALKICDENRKGVNCHKCPLRNRIWNSAWSNHETCCYEKLMRDSAKLLELSSVQPERKTCDGCKHMGMWENEYENGYSSPCTRCVRRMCDNYEK